MPSSAASPPANDSKNRGRPPRRARPSSAGVLLPPTATPRRQDRRNRTGLATSRTSGRVRTGKNAAARTGTPRRQQGPPRRGGRKGCGEDGDSTSTAQQGPRVGAEEAEGRRSSWGSCWWVVSPRRVGGGGRSSGWGWIEGRL